MSGSNSPTKILKHNHFQDQILEEDNEIDENTADRKVKEKEKTHNKVINIKSTRRKKNDENQ